MSNTLFVPIRVRQLHLSEAKAVASAAADFSGLPYYDPDRKVIVNNDSPFLSEKVNNEPFQDDLKHLGSGNHLHFIFPGQFTHAHDNNENLPVPNRWLITKEGEQWVVESDFLSKKLIAGQGSITTIAPIDKEVVRQPGFEIDSNGNFQPFRYMGRQLSLEHWQEIGNQGKEYWASMFGAPLTAFAYGDLEFPIRYPNCRSVFGFYDAAGLANQEYDVIGWYHYPAGQQQSEVVDPVLAQLKTLISIIEEDESLVFEETNQTENARIAAFYERAEAAGWNLGSAEENELGDDLPSVKSALSAITQIVLYTGSNDTLGNAPANPKVKIAIGNNGVEALSAYVASETYSSSSQSQQRLALENKLEAIQFDSLKSLQNDMEAKFGEARHAKGLQAVPSGMLWDYCYVDQQGNQELTESQTEAIRQFEAGDHLKPLALQLHDLNKAQGAYEEASGTVRTKQEQLFSYWYKYMLSAHPPMRHQESYPRVDEVLAYIREHVLPDLDEAMFKAGQLIINPEENLPAQKRVIRFPGETNEMVVAATACLPDAEFHTGEFNAGDSSSSSKASLVVRALQSTFNDLSSLNVSGSFLDQATIEVRLTTKTGTRFHKPNDPVLLLAGDVIPKEVNEDVGLLPSLMLNNIGTTLGSSTNINSIIDELSQVRAALKAHPKGEPEKKDLPWHPMQMEWEATFYPLDSLDNHNGSDNPAINAVYNPNYLANIFDLPSSQPEFAPTKKEGLEENVTPTRNISTYRGFSNLSTYALSFLTEKLAPYAVQEEDDEDAFVPDPDLAKAYRTLQSDNMAVLSQGLNGFNEAFIMRKQALQLAAIVDPVAFDDYKDYISDIGHFIGEGSTTSPMPNNDFNPIRAGGLNITRLNLIDTFGQKLHVYDYFENPEMDVLAPQTMTLPSPNPWDEGTTHNSIQAFLYPRFIQPTRLHARWLAKDFDDHDSGLNPSDTPICGWVVHNILDDSLMLYNTEGFLLGSIRSVNSALFDETGGAGTESVAFIPKPESTASLVEGLIDEQFIENKHLLNFANYLLAKDSQYFGHFLTLLTHAQEFTDPETFEQHPELSLLMGQPIALVRARLNFELQENYANNQSWEEFRGSMLASKEEGYVYSESSYTDGFEHVEIPIRLGDYQQLNDGLIGFWDDANVDAADEATVFHSPVGNLYTDAYYQEKNLPLPENYQDFLEEVEMEITQSAADEPNYLTMLFDPRAQLNITSGVLPVKTIDIPSSLYSNALENIRVTFLMTPIITPKDKLQFPVPKQSGYQWKWIYFEGEDNPLTIPAAATILKSVLNSEWEKLYPEMKTIWDQLVQPNSPTVLEDFPLIPVPEADQLVNGDDQMAYVSFNLITDDNLAKLLEIDHEAATPITQQLMRLLLEHHKGIQPVITTANLGINEIREGWLELTEAPEPREAATANSGDDE